MCSQITLGNILDDLHIPLVKGDYVEHESKPGVILEVISEPYQSFSGKSGTKVRDEAGNVFPVLIEYLHRV